MNYRIIHKDELYHHGVKGMKWGGFVDFKILTAHGLDPQSKPVGKSEKKQYVTMLINGKKVEKITMRSADDWYKKRAKRYAATKAVDIALSIRNRG